MSTGRRIRLLALVNPGYLPSWARRDGGRLDVHQGDERWFRDNIPCQAACPAGTDVPAYIALLADGRYRDSLDLNWQDNVFPGCLGRVCARPCEDACRRQHVDAPVNICLLKRAASEFGETPRPATREAANGLQVAIVGAGPAGLAAARDLSLSGYQVTVFERHPRPGGMLAVGIPPWRLPQSTVDEEIDVITGLGVDIRCGVEIGRDIALRDLIDSYDAVLLALGCQESVRLGVPGEDLSGVVSGLEFLEGTRLGTARSAAGTAPTVIGGGYTSVDCARTVRRLGAPEPVLAYRRGRDDLAVDPHEIAEAEEEGVHLLLNAAPVRILGERGAVVGVEFVRTQSQRRPDGTRELVQVPGSEFVVDADQVIVAIGQRSQRGIDPEGLLGETDRGGAPVVDSEFRTRHPKIWAIGDYARKPRNLIAAIADGRQGAESVDASLRGDQHPGDLPSLTQVMPPEEPSLLKSLLADGVADWTVSTPIRRLRRDDDYLVVAREPDPRRSLPDREIDGSRGFTTEVGTAFSPGIAAAEAQRCLQCQLNIFIDGSRCILCNGCVEACPYDCISMVALDDIASIDGDAKKARDVRSQAGAGATAMVLDETACVRCGKCVDRCPTGCLTMDHFHQGRRG